MFATQMFNGLGINWAASLLGFVALALVPVPIAFSIWGARLRAKSKFAPKLPSRPPAPPPPADEEAGGDGFNGTNVNSKGEEKKME
jgi:MFS transporter, DHA1 family, multidrug resistance protein